jgi:co-chaperonin GroES (HSP10)
MAQAILAVHASDPKQEIFDEIGQYVDDLEPLNVGIVVAVYKRPEKTAGGVFIADRSRDNDETMGKVGLVLRLGEMAFQDDPSHRFGTRKPKVGDWVVFTPGDTRPFHLGTRMCRFIEDVNVRAITQRPDIIW